MAALVAPDVGFLKLSFDIQIFVFFLQIQRSRHRHVIVGPIGLLKSLVLHIELRR